MNNWDGIVAWVNARQRENPRSWLDELIATTVIWAVDCGVIAPDDVRRMLGLPIENRRLPLQLCDV